jgi:CHASE3 domain sensor protein
VSESTELQRSIEALTRMIDQLRTELVRKDVYVADQLARDAVQSNIVDDVRDLRKDFADDKADRKRDKERTEAQRAADRRLIITALVAPLLLILIQLYIAAQTGK